VSEPSPACRRERFVPAMFSWKNICHLRADWLKNHRMRQACKPRNRRRATQPPMRSLFLLVAECLMRLHWYELPRSRSCLGAWLLGYSSCPRCLARYVSRLLYPRSAGWRLRECFALPKSLGRPGYRYFVIENERASAPVMGGGYGYLQGEIGSAFGAPHTAIQKAASWCTR
jgi:hypothetical protein